MKSLRPLLSYLKPEIPILLLAYVCMVVLGLTTAFYAFLAGPALRFIFSGTLSDIVYAANGEMHTVWKALPADWIQFILHLDPKAALAVMPGLIVVTAFIKGISQTGQFFLTGRISQRILRKLRARIFSSLLSQSPEFFERRSHGDLLSRLTHDANLVEQAIFYGCAPLLREPLTLVFLLGFCFVTDPKLALVTFVIVPLALFPLVRFARRLKRVSRKGQDSQGLINASAYEALAGIRVVQAFGTEAQEKSKLQNAANRYYTQMLKSYFVRAVRTPTMEFLGAFALAGLLALLGYYAQTGRADPAHYISFFVAVVMMYDPLKKIGNVTDFLAAGAAAADRIFEIVNHPPHISDAPNATPLNGFRDKIVFDHVEFSYQDTPVLQNVQLELPLGSVVALVGSSGAGKTTLANLLPRFYDVTQGCIKIDGNDIRAVTLASLRSQISVVSQDTFLFNSSVKENIAYGKSDATTDQIQKAARAAYAEEFIVGLEQGYETRIGERGVKLSGGQKQRLAIARALLRNSPILILDEATSSLDIESEQYVQQALEILMQGRTSLVIAHRLSTVRRADMIAVLKSGSIVERGCHEELLALGGEYARLYEMQFQDAHLDGDTRKQEICSSS